MNKEDLLYIEDAQNRKLYYRFTPAALASNFVPLMVVLHGEEKAEALHFEYKMWNILTPLDTFGHADKGSCWLGEKGDFFVKALLQELIRQIADEYECEEHIYLYGSSTGGYGAILHGILCKANAVFAHAPQVRLPKANTTDTVFSQNVSAENDLSNFLASSGSYPIFYLCDDKDLIKPADASDLEDDVLYFADACKKHGIDVRLDFCPDAGEDETYRLKKVMDMFERVPS